MSLDPRVSAVLDFWFGTNEAEAPKRWFTKDPAFDARLREAFGDLHASASRGEIEAWHAAQRAKESVLAYVVVMDQFSRNLHRASALAFANDERALAATESAMAEG